MPEGAVRKRTYPLKAYRGIVHLLMLIFPLLLLLFCRCHEAASTHDPPAPSGSTTPFAVIKDETLFVEISSTPKDRTLGLMFRDTLPEMTGMLFIFEFEARHSFWMKNTTIPLSIAFINSNHTIVDIQDMAPLSLKEHTPRFPCLFALEVNQHWFKKHGIGIGDSVQVHF